jgi:hypothetical protein
VFLQRLTLMEFEDNSRITTKVNRGNHTNATRERGSPRFRFSVARTPRSRVGLVSGRCMIDDASDADPPKNNESPHELALAAARRERFVPTVAAGPSG